MSSGSAVMVSPKTYSMIDDTDATNAKKAMKGISNRNRTIHHEHLLKAVYQGETTLSSECKFRWNKKLTAMETIHQTRKSVNPIFTKLKLSENCVTISPLSYTDDNGDEILV